MAKLLKHLGIGGKKPAPNSPKLEYDPQRLDRARACQLLDPAGSQLSAGNDTDSSSTVSSAATGGSDEFPPPPSAWTLQQALAADSSSGQAFAGARPKDARGNRQHFGEAIEKQKYGGTSATETDTTDSDLIEFSKNLAKLQKPKDAFESTNIYENQVMFDPSLQILDNESLQEVKKWLGEVNSDSSVEGNLIDIRPRAEFDIQSKQKDAVVQQGRFHSHLDNSRKASSRVSDQIVPVRKGTHQMSGKDDDATFGAALKEIESEYEKSNPATREPDYERYTQLREELKLELGELTELPEEDQAQALDVYDVHVGKDENPMTKSDGYEEPWDLEAAQGEIEDQFNGVLVGEWILREMPTDKKTPTSPQAPVMSSSSPVAAEFAGGGSSSGGSVPPHELDIRTQRGYEKPWDWKPHMKDSRGPEGYEKPWDWKPHMKDDRPPKEYEEPWDKKSKNVENEVIAAKIAKEAAKAGKDPTTSCGVTSQGKMNEDFRGQEGYDKPWDLKPHMKDGRPLTEYEEPWDTKAKDIESELIAAKIAKEAAKASAAEAMPDWRAAALANSNQERAAGLKKNTKDGKSHVENEAVINLRRINQVTRTASEDSAKSSRPGVSSPAQRRVRMSPKKKAGLTPELESRNRIGERIQMRIPLEEQGWYHGTISRGDAEGILHGHQEGSYLVRHSESGADEFSLSVKSSRGFMHMKIVFDRDGKYILGQFSQPFMSIPQMIQYYTVSKLPIKGAEHMSLLYPVSRNILA